MNWFLKQYLLQLDDLNVDVEKRRKSVSGLSYSTAPTLQRNAERMYNLTPSSLVIYFPK